MRKVARYMVLFSNEKFTIHIRIFGQLYYLLESKEYLSNSFSIVIQLGVTQLARKQQQLFLIAAAIVQKQFT